MRCLFLHIQAVGIVVAARAEVGGRPRVVPKDSAPVSTFRKAGANAAQNAVSRMLRVPSLESWPYGIPMRPAMSSRSRMTVGESCTYWGEQQHGELK